MREKLRMKNMALCLVLALAMVISMMPVMTLPSHAAMHYEVYIDDGISNGEVSSDKPYTLGSGETVTLTVTPGDGYKLKKLSVIQPDVLDSVSDLVDLMGDAEFANNDGYSVKIDEGKFSVFHNDEKIASLDNSENFTNTYGAGGRYTVNNASGFWEFYIIGGKLRTIEFSKSNNNLTFHGIGAKTISGTEIATTTVTEGKTYTFAAPASNVYVTAEFEMLDPKTVLIDVGKGHESLFTADVLNEIETLFELEDVTISGNIVTLKGVHPSTTEYDMWYVIADFVNDLVEPADFMHNKEWFRDPAYKPIDEYATSSDLNNDIYDEVHESTPVSEGLTYYLFWAKPYEKLEIDNGNPTCGNEMWKAFPTVPDGFMVDPEDSVWRDENGERVRTFEGGKTYTFSGRIYLRPYGALWKYFLDEDNFTLTVKDGKDLEYSLNGDTIKLSYKATADHDWDEGKVTKEATCTEKGEKTFACKYNDEDWHKEKPATKTEEIAALGHKYGAWTKLDDKQHQRVCENDKSHVEKANHTWDAGKVTKEATETAEGVKTYTCTVCKATKTESIPKLDPKPEPKPEPKPTPEKKSTAKPVIVAKGIASGKTAVNISWNKVKGADRYVIYFSRCNYKGKTYTLKKVKTVNAKTLKWKKKKLNKNTSYKFYVVAQKKSGKTYKTVAKSYVGHFLTGNTRNELTNPKSLKLNKSKLTIKKGKSATIKGSVTKAVKSKKLATTHASKLRFISNNPSVATVNAKGKVTAKKKGTATIYVQTINGIWKTCKVTVK